MRGLVVAILMSAGAARAEIPADSSPELSRTVRVYTHDVVMCLGRAHKKGRTPTGSLLMSVDVQDGHATQATIEEDATESKGLAKCVRRSMRAWMYQAVEDGHYTWRFEYRVADREPVAHAD